MNTSLIPSPLFDYLKIYNLLLPVTALFVAAGLFGGFERANSVAEKLRVMETIWADLSRDEAQFESPSWHGEVLKEREEKIKSGAESFIDWETAKKQLRELK